jgi:tRNA(adenine34) deaminase
VSLLIRDDEEGMQAALREARASAAADEVPVGCVIVHQGAIIGRGHNQVETLEDATAHAEILAIGAASNALGTWRLTGCMLYVTLEPCAMCAGAIILARVERLVYGAADPKAGACGSVLDVIHERRLNHRVEVAGGVLAEPSGELLKEFFAKKRRAGKGHDDAAARGAEGMARGPGADASAAAGPDDNPNFAAEEPDADTPRPPRRTRAH